MKKRRLSVTILLAALLMLCLSISASAGFKKMPNGKYRYYTQANVYLSGRASQELESTARWTFKKIKYNGVTYTYCFDEKGYMLTGTKMIYTQPKGEMAGWRRYLFNNNGRLVGQVDTTVFKGKFVKNKKGIRYRLPDKTYVVKQWKLIDGHWYYFYSTGYMAKSTKVGSHRVNSKGWKIS